MEIKEMFDLKQRNYDWESFRLEVPKKYSDAVMMNQVPSGAIFGKKDNYLDLLQKDKKQIPGPTDYKAKEVKQRPKSGKMDKAQRLTFSEQVKATSAKENIPGPGAYFKRPKSAISKSPSSMSKDKADIEKQHYLTEVQYLAGNYPGVGEYNLSQPQHVVGPKLMKRASSSRKRLGKQNKKQDLNFMHFYSGTFEFLKEKGKRKNSNYFGCSKRFVTESKYQKKPSPTSYTMNHDWSQNRNILKVTCNTMGTTGKSVYYH